MKYIKSSLTFTLLSFIIVLSVLQACKKSRSDIGKALFQETRNKVYKGIESEAFITVFKQALEEKKSTLRNPRLITAFYEENEFEPVLVLRHLPKKGLKAMTPFLLNAADHGLDPAMFDASSFEQLVNKVYDKRGIKSVEEAYKAIAELELVTANSLIDYSNALQYGVISPRKIYAQYYTETKRPDSATMKQVLAVKDLKSYLDSIQPKSAPYLALQKARNTPYATGKYGTTALEK
jgi:murein L,D-transpeptidase YcbB/YkuD